MSKTKAGLVQRIVLISTNDETEFINFDKSYLPIPYFSDNAILIDISNYIPKDFDIEYVTFLTQNIPNSTLNIVIKDKEKTCSRPLISNKMLFSGDKISITMKEQIVGSSFSIQIRYFVGDAI